MRDLIPGRTLDARQVLEEQEMRAVRISVWSRRLVESYERELLMLRLMLALQERVLEKR